MRPTTSTPIPKSRQEQIPSLQPSFYAEIWFDKQFKVLKANTLARQWFALSGQNYGVLDDDWMNNSGVHLSDRQFRSLSITKLLKNQHSEVFAGLALPKETRWLRWEVKHAEDVSVLFMVDVTELMRDLFSLEQMADDANTRDIATRLYNRRYAMERLSQMHNHSKRYHSTFALALVDVDYFKRINDTFGHAFGDEVILKIAEVIRKGFRGTDLCARIGGEEFMILMPETETNEAIYSIDRLRQQISELKWPQMQRPVTISSGVVSWQENKSIEQLIFIADQRLTTAKRAGRNQVCGDLI
jgi:diguanylate cyclase